MMVRDDRQHRPANMEERTDDWRCDERRRGVIMEYFQRRVVEEKAQLDAKLAKLRSFMNGSVFPTLPGDDQDLLSEQANLMQQYSDVLNRRIERFSARQAN
jgi:hypothetical protein